MSKELGKIKSVKFGIGGYNDSQIGIHFDLRIGTSSGVMDSKSAWDLNRVKHTKHCSWSEDDLSKSYADIMRFVSNLLKDAQVTSIDQLKNIPIELEMDNMKLKSWRVLTEVI